MTSMRSNPFNNLRSVSGVATIGPPLGEGFITRDNFLSEYFPINFSFFLIKMEKRRCTQPAKCPYKQNYLIRLSFVFQN